MSELPSLLPLNRQRIIKSTVKIRVPRSSNVSVWIKEGVFFHWVLFWPEISALGVFLNFDNERMYPPKYLNAPLPPGGLANFRKGLWPSL